MQMLPLDLQNQTRSLATRFNHSKYIYINNSCKRGRCQMRQRYVHRGCQNHMIKKFLTGALSYCQQLWAILTSLTAMTGLQDRISLLFSVLSPVAPQADLKTVLHIIIYQLSRPAWDENRFFSFFFFQCQQAEVKRSAYWFFLYCQIIPGTLFVAQNQTNQNEILTGGARAQW